MREELEHLEEQLNAHPDYYLRLKQLDSEPKYIVFEAKVNGQTLLTVKGDADQKEMVLLNFQCELQKMNTYGLYLVSKQGETELNLTHGG